jgi:predicted nucleic acid-binding protein
LRLYLDACCLNRLTDDQSQSRVRTEAEAVERILRLIRRGRATWVSSAVLEVEIGRNPDPDRCRDVAALLPFADEVVVPQSADADRAALLERLGFGAFDALHLACAERGAADVFLTTDDDLLRRARRQARVLRIRVENPVSWYQEVAV